MKTLTEFAAKLRLIAYLGECGVTPEILAAAKAKLGADLCDALSSDLGKSLRDRFDSDIDRLERLDFQDGDQVSCATGNTYVSGKIASSSDDNFTVISGGKKFAAVRANITSEELTEIRELSKACKAFLP